MEEQGYKQSNFKGFLIWVYNHRFIAAIPFVICLLLVFAYMNLTTKEYQQSTAITLKFAHNGAAMTRDLMLFNEISFVKRQTTFDNEKEFFGSIAMAEELVKMVNMQNEVYTDGWLTSKLLYKDSPINFTLDANNNCETFTADAYLSDNDIHITNITVNGIDYPGKMTLPYGVPFKTKFGILTINKTENKTKYKKLTIKHRDASTAAKYVSKRLQFYTATMFATVLNFNYTDYSPERAKDIVTNLPKAYNTLWHEYIKSTTQESGAFINRQMRLVEKELKMLESEVATLSEKNKSLIPQIDNLETAKKMAIVKGQKIISETDLFIARNALEHIKATGDSLTLLPMNTIAGNKFINIHIAEYNARVLQIKKIATNGKNNPTAKSIEQNAQKLKRSIVVSLENHIANAVKIAMRLEKESQNVDNRISQSSKTELLKASKQRRIELLQKIYIYLKHKQEECSMAMNINLNAVRIIRNATNDINMVSPNLPSAIFLAIIFGLILIPYAIYLTGGAFNTKILFLKELTDFSILGRLPALSKRGSIENDTKYSKQQLNPKIFVKENYTDNINDAFRIIRTNLDFLLPKDGKGHVIGVASIGNPLLSATIALNIAITMFYKTKRTLLVDFDLRHSPLALTDKGLSNVLNKEVSIKQAIDNKTFSGLDFISAGQEAPNALELIATKIDKTEWDYLRKEYDYIILNLSPIERFTDAKLVAQYCDITTLAIESNTINVEYIDKLKEIASSNEYPRLTLTLCGFRK